MAGPFLLLQSIKETTHTQVRIRCRVLLAILMVESFRGGEYINIKDAIVERFRQLCGERNISYTELARLAGVTPSTVYSMLQPERRDISIVTVKKLCDGLDLSIIDFFDNEIFRSLLPEIE